MKKWYVPIAIIVIVGLGVGGYFVFHKSKTPATTNNSSSGTSSEVIITKTSSSLGKYLAEPDGQPLYTYGGDSNGVSNCTGSCLSLWPPYVDRGSTSGLPSHVGTIKRTDSGQIQYTYNGLPLYLFVSDTSSNEPSGNGVSNFKLAAPVASTTSSSTSTNSNSYNY